MAPVRQFTAPLSGSVLEETRKVVQHSGVLGLPTETFYALAACPFDAAAVERIGRIKGRPDTKPILILLAEADQLGTIAAQIPRAAEILMQHFWPGPLTIVFPAARSLPHALTGGTGTIGVRQPHYPLLRDLLQTIGAVTGTSANRSGVSPHCTAEGVQQELGRDVDLILDGGRTSGGLPSTVVSVAGTVRLLREGRIARETLTSALATAGMALMIEGTKGT